ncbi:MAG: transglycosylase domain-containing protein [Candidatus Shapirobacteria bacterium]|jgi:1A family penicillin-binding protein
MEMVIKILIGLGKPILLGIKVVLKHFGYVFLTLILMVMTGGLVWGWQRVIAGMPNIDKIYEPPSMTSKITDRNGRVLYKYYEKENRSWVNLEKIPKVMVEATLAIEDKDFYNHHGISWRGIIKAIWHNFTTRGNNNGLWGGSTITQQLAKNVFLNGEKTWVRKAREAILAIMLERKLTKDEILERYFNQVPYGGEIYGVAEAAKKFFDKDISEISVAEATFLAGLPAAPTAYLPRKGDLELGKERQKQVLNQMVTAGYLTEMEADKISREELKIIEPRIAIKAPHFVFYIRDYLKDKMGIENIGRQGLTVKTTLDLDQQLIAEKIVKNEVEKVRGLGISNGAALVLEVRTGKILAMVGSKDYFANDIDGKFNVTTALRQPGSSIKPINYLLAIQNGKTLMDMIDDSPVTYYVKGQKPYSPQNYNGKYMGRVTLKTALASSLNVPSVKLLAENGVEEMIDLGRKMGITSWDQPNRFGLSLALGSGEVKMTELSQAYSIFANLGEKAEINPIVLIENYMGETVYERINETRMVVEPKYAFLINQALADNEARTPIFGANSKLKITGKTVAVKTGTTNSLRDNWCIGWTPDLLVATWVGNNDNHPMGWVASGVSGATPIWYEIMSQALAKKGNMEWEPPMDVYKASVCGKEEYFTDGREINIKCPMLKPTGEPPVKTVN